jgi:hypothetical protein
MPTARERLRFSLSERQLVLEQGGGTILTLFRVEGRTVK